MCMTLAVEWDNLVTQKWFDIVFWITVLRLISISCRQDIIHLLTLILHREGKTARGMSAIRGNFVNRC